MGRDFISGTISNLVFLPGASYINKGTDRWGGELLIGYNLPKMGSADWAPFLVPLVGIHYLDQSWYGFSGTVSLQSTLHPLRIFTRDPNNLAYALALSIYGVGGVGQNLSGETFGGFTVPGKTPQDGQGTAAVTGYGVNLGLFQTANSKFSLWGSRTKWTTIDGDIYSFGLAWQYSPAGW